MQHEDRYRTLQRLIRLARGNAIQNHGINVADFGLDVFWDCDKKTSYCYRLWDTSEGWFLRTPKAHTYKVECDQIETVCLKILHHCQTIRQFKMINDSDLESFQMKLVAADHLTSIFRKEDSVRLKKLGWILLSSEEEQSLWSHFESRYELRREQHSLRWSGIAEPQGSVTFSAVHAEITPAKFILTQRAMAGILHEIMTTREFKESHWYALDWNHPCFQFQPTRLTFPTNLDNWPIWPLPNGDYCVFWNTDFENGMFIHPIEQSMCIFGAKLVSVLSQHPLLPKCLTVLRRDGREAP